MRCEGVIHGDRGRARELRYRLDGEREVETIERESNRKSPSMVQAGC